MSDHEPFALVPKLHTDSCLCLRIPGPQIIITCHLTLLCYDSIFQIVLAFDDCGSFPHLCVRFVTNTLDSNICISFNALHTVWCDIICILYTTLCIKLITWTLHITLSAVYWCTLHTICVLSLTHEHSTPQAHSAQLSKVQSWRCTLNCDEMLHSLCPFLKTKLAQLFHSERMLDLRRAGQSVPARPLSTSLKTNNSCDHFQNPGINSG